MSERASSNLPSRSEEQAPNTRVVPPSPVEPVRVLVAVNGSGESYAALEWSRHAATVLGARLDVIDVAEREDREMDDAEATTQLEQIRSRLSAHIADRQFDVDGIVVERGPVPEVLAGHAGDADLLVIGAHPDDGKRSCHHVELVSALARLVDRPIVIVPPGEWHDDHQPVMVGVDGSEGNCAVFRWARWFAAQVGRPLIAVHVIDPIFRTFESADRLSTEDVAVRHEVELSGVEIVERVDADPGRSLATFAATRHAGVLIVGARVRHSSGGRLLGGVATNVIERARCPVVIAPWGFQIANC